MESEHYTILFTKQPPDGYGSWEGPVWKNIPSLAVDCFRPEGSAHRPQTLCKMLYDREKIYVIFRVADQYVRCTRAGFQVDVCKDSCVEFFVKPQNCRGYFNFEFNCGGAMLASYVTDPVRAYGQVKEALPLAPEDDRQIQRQASLPEIVEPEITKKLIWQLEFSLPFLLLEKYAGVLGEIQGQTWRANFYKCGDETTHPHWASWSELTARNFHAPDNFGYILFK
ncbi:MAG TPA: carbohydrate-binding family 9-like protein [Smithellaceae bacterium]|nr:carbohydrate-binding family 9-like protein [Smithellaceae bacterium]